MKCTVCGSEVTIDEDNDSVKCGYCGAEWESIESFREESSIRTEKQKKNWKNNLLMYLETCMVDHGGKFRWNKIGDDEVFLDELVEEGLIKYSRLPFSEIETLRYNSGPGGPFTHIITEFTEQAWDEAHRLRRARADRLKDSFAKIKSWSESFASEK